MWICLKVSLLNLSFAIILSVKAVIIWWEDGGKVDSYVNNLIRLVFV